MDQVIEHAAGDLVARVQAGTTIGQLAVALASAGQQLALDAPEDATVGGVVATGTAGPRRFRYGAARDLLIGLTMVRADGVIAHSGGKVVKNVAGYDIGKLFSGSQGTLGLITEATFRLHPVPAAVAWVTAEFGPAERAEAAPRRRRRRARPWCLRRWSSTGRARRSTAAAAGRRPARGHLLRAWPTGQADVRAAGGGGRIARGGRVRGGACPVGRAACGP